MREAKFNLKTVNKIAAPTIQGELEKHSATLIYGSRVQPARNIITDRLKAIFPEEQIKV